MCVCVCVCAHAWVRTCLVGECDLCAHDTLICSVVRLDVCAGSPVSQSAQNDENSLRYLLTLILCQASNRFECHLTHAFWSHSLLMPSTFGIFPAKCHCRRRTWQRKKKEKCGVSFFPRTELCDGSLAEVNEKPLIFVVQSDNKQQGMMAETLWSQQSH